MRLLDPQRIVPGNAMPDMAMSEADARAYLDTLRLEKRAAAARLDNAFRSAISTRPGKAG
jgi:hypothetical protein